MRVVPNDSRDAFRVSVCGAGGNPSTSQPVVAGFGVGFDEDVVALPAGNLDAVRCKGLDGHQVVGDDRQVVSVNAELEPPLDGYVGQPQSVRLSRLENNLELLATTHTLRIGGASAVPGVGAVDKTSFHLGRSTLLGLVPEGKGLGVGPIAEGDGPEVDVVVGASRAVEDHGPKQALGILQAEVAVVPCGAVLGNLKLVRHALAGRDGALGDARDAVVLDRLVLPQAVPVDGAPVGLHVICNVDHHVVTPVGDESRAGDGAVESHAGTLIAVRGAVALLQAQPVFAGCAGVRDDIVIVGLDRIIAPAIPGGW